MNDQLVANASVVIEAPAEEVWAALVDPDLIKQYMFGATVASDWHEGSPITWSGEWEGRSYEDKGMILEFSPHTRLQYTHYSPLTGQPDAPENYHTVTVHLAEEGGWTRVDLSQDNNTTDEDRDHSQQNWQSMLDSLKQLVEKERAMDAPP